MRKIIDQVGADGVTDDEIRQLFNMIDKDKSGKLSLRVTIINIIIINYKLIINYY